MKTKLLKKARKKNPVLEHKGKYRYINTEPDINSNYTYDSEWVSSTKFFNEIRRKNILKNAKDIFDNHLIKYVRKNKKSKL